LAEQVPRNRLVKRPLVRCGWQPVKGSQPVKIEAARWLGSAF
jgi:hypothetical protein